MCVRLDLPSRKASNDLEIVLLHEFHEIGGQREEADSVSDPTEGMLTASSAARPQRKPSQGKWV